jgi:hypothetical protein
MVDLKNKLKNLPTIYYVNLDHRFDRRDYMESQFDKWEIINYKRISGSKYLGSKIEEWKNIFVGENKSPRKDFPSYIGNSITHLEMVKEWLVSTNDKYMIMMEDDYDLSLIEYWHFDWNCLMNNLPYDWDCIQIGFESTEYINFYLHPKVPLITFFGACMINRRYAEKLISIHYNNEGKIILNKNTNRPHEMMMGNTIDIDYFMCENGKTYCIPLITCNNDFGSYENNIHIDRPWCVKSRELYYEWWTTERDNFTLRDFFTYGKGYDKLMRKYII